MRLIGRPDLMRLARGSNPLLRDAVLALAAELEAASWRTPEEARVAFPSAVVDGGGLTIDLDGRHCVVVAISYEKGVALVESAGPGAGRRVAGATQRGRTA